MFSKIGKESGSTEKKLGKLPRNKHFAFKIPLIRVFSRSFRRIFAFSPIRVHAFRVAFSRTQGTRRND